MLESIPRTPRYTVDFLVDLNRRLATSIGYVVRLEPGIQTLEETLSLGSGSCRDTSWLLVQLYRHLGIAARFVSGYLIQLAGDPDGSDGPAEDIPDLHAWAEVFLPGAGWIGLDPTSGMLTGEGHIPLAASPRPDHAAPITGTTELPSASFEHEMVVHRLGERPRPLRPFLPDTWAAIDRARPRRSTNGCRAGTDLKVGRLPVGQAGTDHRRRLGGIARRGARRDSTASRHRRLPPRRPAGKQCAHADRRRGTFRDAPGPARLAHPLLAASPGPFLRVLRRTGRPGGRGTTGGRAGRRPARRSRAGASPTGHERGPAR